jgi:aryl-phospho-beta-D-glucosidase BglC (GH1 family)
MKRLGANVVRVPLQFGKFMTTADRPTERSLERLGKLLDLAERNDLYLDLTGLACYRKADVPGWYDALSEAKRWAAQARFWEAISERCGTSPAVFCYDLMNEPFVAGGPRKAGDWYSGTLLGGYDFVQFIALDTKGRPRGRDRPDMDANNGQGDSQARSIATHHRRHAALDTRLGILIGVRARENRAGSRLHCRPCLSGEGQSR